jgi:hypothetical protein
MRIVKKYLKNWAQEASPFWCGDCRNLTQLAIILHSRGNMAEGFQGILTIAIATPVRT